MKEYVVHYNNNGAVGSVVVQAKNNNEALAKFKQLNESADAIDVRVNEMIFG